MGIEYPGLVQNETDWKELVATWIEGMPNRHIRASILGHVFYDLALFEQSLRYNEKALGMSHAKDPRGYGAALSNIGLIHHHRGQYNDAGSSFRSALDVFTSIPYSFGIATSYNNIGSNCIALGQNEESRSNLQCGLEYCLGHDFVERILCLAYLYNSFGDLHFRLGEYDKSIDYYSKALDIHINGNKLEEGQVYAEIGKVHQALGNSDVAKDHYRRAEGIMVLLGRKTDARSLRDKILALESSASPS